ncbi:MAG: hypothetical protein HC768_17860 [Acaryochloris sp. CRU_2_0]|nr:hypothetical protein [Acaryochloris sp. CRU_2_0]
MTERTDFVSQIPTPQLDPLRVGEVMGQDAFTQGDWVLLRLWENRPSKVICLHENLIYVEQVEREGFVDSLVHYPQELGYPLDHRFWSQHQKRCYALCHLEPKLVRRWQRDSPDFVNKVSDLEVFCWGVITSVIALVVSRVWLHCQALGSFLTEGESILP